MKLDRVYGLFILLTALVLYLSSLANGINIPDGVLEAMKIRDYLLNGSGWLNFSHNPFYFLTIIDFVKIFGSNIDFFMNLFSAITTSLAAVVVYKIGQLYFDKKMSFFASLIFILTPYVWFHATNAKFYSLYFLTISFWVYFLLKSIKTKSKVSGIISSIMYTLVSFTNFVVSIPLLIIQIILLRKLDKNWKWLLKNLLIIALIENFFIISFVLPSQRESLIGRYYSVVSPFTIAFMVLETVWEYVNALSIGLFILVVSSIFLIFKRKQFDEMNTMFILILILSSGSFLVSQYTPIIGYTSSFVLIPLIAVRYLKNKLFILIPIIFLLILKFAPLAYELHTYPHPHYQYVLWLNENYSDKVVLAGHECPWINYYTNITVRPCGTFPASYDVPLNNSTVITEQFFVNENRMEWDIAKNKLGIILPFLKAVEPQVGKPILTFENKTLIKIATFTDKTRSIEDPYQFFFSINGNIIMKIFIPYDYLTPEYSVYQIKT